MADETATRLLHRLTSYQPDREWHEPLDDDRLLRDLQVNDPDRRPMAYKEYPGDLPRTELPTDLPGSTAPALDVLAGTADVAPGTLDLAALGRVLYLASGVTRTAVRDGVRFLFRAAGSAGARFPLELYVAAPDRAVPGLRGGVHWYDPEEHELVTVGPAPHGTAPSVVVTGVPWRSGWRYRERAFRHVYWDAGTMLAHVLAAADSAGLGARLFTALPDDEVAALVGADGVREWPVAVVALGPGDPALHPTGDAMAGRHDADGLVFPLVTDAQRAGVRTALGPERERGAAAATASTPEPVPVEDVVLRKGSVRRLRPDAGVALAAAQDALAVSLRGVDVPHWVATNRVDGLAPGVYRWPDLASPVRALAEDDLRAELWSASLEQGLPRDASFVVVSAVDLRDVDDHRYREVQLDAGLVEGRLHLAAVALGLAASGMTFRDTDVPALLAVEDPATDLGCLLWTCVGVPEYRTRRSGDPGSPAEVTVVWPR